LRRTEEFVRLLDIDRDMIGFHANSGITPLLNKWLTWLTRASRDWPVDSFT
jgi:hypothetical protein